MTCYPRINGGRTDKQAMFLLRHTRCGIYNNSVMSMGYASQQIMKLAFFGVPVVGAIRWKASPRSAAFGWLTDLANLNGLRSAKRRRDESFICISNFLCCSLRPRVPTNDK